MAALAERRVTFGYLNTQDVPPSQLPALAAAAGFKSVGLRITGRRPGEAYEEIVGNRTKIDEIKRRAADLGIFLSNISSYHLYPDVHVDQFRPVFDVTAEFGARTVVCGCYFDDEEAFGDYFAELAGIAATFGVRPSLEFVPFSKCRNIDQALRILRKAGDKAALVVDALHLQRSGGTPELVARLPASCMVFAQLCDAPAHAPPDLIAEARTGRLHLGDGELPLDALLDALPRDIELEIETPVAADSGLPPLERARRIHERTTAFLERYAAARRQEA
jgi:sugar phosphate isomerase/epimerase